MSPVAIPHWNFDGVLPPYDESDPASHSRSPYDVSLTDLILRFATSNDRKRILDGLLRFREALHAVGLTQGFQWIDGSFLENVEATEARNPADIDVVTFYHLPASNSQETLFSANPDLFDNIATKRDFHVDAYFIELGSMSPEDLTTRVAYWYSLWAHRRDALWKGFLKIDLANVDDLTAKVNLSIESTTGGQT